VAAALVTAGGTALRGLGGLAPLYAGTLLAGAAIALSQVVVPALIRVRAPGRTGVLTGAYSMALVGGATVATFTAIPFENVLGSWEAALAVWALPAVAAALVWLPLAAQTHEPVPPPAGTPLWRDATAWSIALLMGLQSMAFFSTVTWLPELLEANGASEGYAGTLTGLTQLIQVAPAFAIPVLAARTRTQTHLLALIVGTALAGLLGVLLAPDAAVLWMVLLGIGQGGSLGLALILPVLRGHDPAQVAGMTAMAMGVGYLIASTGPALVGATRDVTGDWTWPVLVIVAMTVAEVPAALRAVRPTRSP
jgi:CP family cyanate transporter-like MFS transporter